MKNIIIFALIFFPHLNSYSQDKKESLSEKKEKLEAINSYLETIIKDQNKAVFIAQEKLNFSLTIDIFKSNYIQAIDLNGDIRPDNQLFNKKYWILLKKQNKDKPVQDNKIWDTHKYWNKKDFKSIKIIFESMNTKTGIELIIKKYDKSDICIYSFSEPMYYQNKKYLVFTNLKICISGGNGFVVVMKKIKSKWIITHEAFNPNEIN